MGSIKDIPPAWRQFPSCGSFMKAKFMLSFWTCGNAGSPGPQGVRLPTFSCVLPEGQCQECQVLVYSLCKHTMKTSPASLEVR